jgi:hypothetical protein
MNLNVIFPCHPFEINKIHPDFESEYNTVLNVGGTTRLINEEEFDTSLSSAMWATVLKPFKHLSIEECDQKWIYRGWMMTGEKYGLLFDRLYQFRSCELLVSPNEYSNCHYFNKSYEKLVEYTMPMYRQFSSDVNHELLNEHLSGKVFVKDFVKSAKEYEDATIINDASNKEEVERVVGNLVRYRGDNFYEGLIFKQFIEIQENQNNNKEEYRVFFLNSEIVSVSHTYGDTVSKLKENYIRDFLKDIRLDSKFYTIDVLFDTNDKLYVLECGDGQVSGLSPNQNEFAFYSSMQNILN